MARGFDVGTAALQAAGGDLTDAAAPQPPRVVAVTDDADPVRPEDDAADLQVQDEEVHWAYWRSPSSDTPRWRGVERAPPVTGR